MSKQTEQQELGAPQAADLRQTRSMTSRNRRPAGPFPQIRLESQSEGTSLGLPRPTTTLETTLEESILNSSLGHRGPASSADKAGRSRQNSSTSTASNHSSATTHSLSGTSGNSRSGLWDEVKDGILSSLVQNKRRVNWLGAGGVVEQFNTQASTRYNKMQLKNRWYQLKSRVERKAEEEDTDGAEASGAAEDSQYSREDRVLYTLCHNLSKVDWKHRILAKFNSICGTNWTVDQARGRWYRLRKAGARPALINLGEEMVPAHEIREREIDEQGGNNDVQETMEAQPSANLDGTEQFLQPENREQAPAPALLEEMEKNARTKEYTPENDATQELEATTGPNETDDDPAENEDEGEPTDVTQENWNELFTPVFVRTLGHSKRTFARKGPRQPAGKVPNGLLSFANDTVFKALQNRPKDSSQLGWVNSVTYAAATAIVAAMRELGRGKLSAKNEKYWFEKKQATIRELERTIHLIECELRRRQKAGVPNKAQRARRKELFALIKERRTEAIKKKQSELQERLAIVQQRVDLRKEEKQRKMLRRLFAKQPSLKVLERFTKSNQTSHSEQNQSRSDTINMQAVRQFWEPIIGKAAVGTDAEIDSNKYMAKFKAACAKAYTEETLSDEDIKAGFSETVRKMRPWKAAGPDGIQAFWWKSIQAAQDELRRITIELIQGRMEQPAWVTRGRTVLLYKSGDPMDPSNYRPITCLNTCYKIVTGVLNRLVVRHIRGGPADPPQQRALKQGQWACLHAALLDRTVVGDATWHRTQRGMHMAWVDFRKAFDSIGHRYLRWVLQVVKVPEAIRTYLGKCMPHWETRFEIGARHSQRIVIRRGIFQGDSLSPTLFAIAIAPISTTLADPEFGYKTGYGRIGGKELAINHQFYMDDLKCYARSSTTLENMLNSVSNIGRIAGLEINPSKCSVVSTAKRERWEVRVDESAIISLGPEEGYKYLGCYQRIAYTASGMDAIFNKVIAKAAAIAQSKLSVNQKRAAFRSIVLPTVGYVYTLTSGGDNKLGTCRLRAQRLDKKLRKLLVTHKIITKPSCTARLYLDVGRGGQGWPSIEDELENAILAAFSYLVTEGELTFSFKFFTAMSKRGKRTVISDAQAIFGRYGIDAWNISEEGFRLDGAEQQDPRTLRRTLINRVSEVRMQRRLAEWQTKQMASKILRISGVSVKHSFSWLRIGHISSTNARNAIAAQEGCLRVRGAPVSRIRGAARQNMQCRQCSEEKETICHVVSNCNRWLSTLYLDRHNRVARCLHFWFCQKFRIQPVHYSQAVPARLVSDRGELLWDMTIQTMAVMDHRKPDIVVIDRLENRAIIIEVAVAWMQNIRKQIDIKTNRYTVNSVKQDDETKTPYEKGPNLKDDMSDRLGMRVDFLPLVIGTQGEIMEDTAAALKMVLRTTASDTEDLIARISRSAVLGTSRIIKRHLASDTLPKANNPHKSTA